MSLLTVAICLGTFLIAAVPSTGKSSLKSDFASNEMVATLPSEEVIKGGLDYELKPGQTDGTVRAKNVTDYPLPAPNGSAIRTLRIAIATTGTFSSHFFLGATTDAQKRQNVSDYLDFAVARLSEVFEDELAVRFELVPNNDNLIFLDAATDEYTDVNSDDNDKNQIVVNRIIGSANYDIGHVFTGDNGGVAILGGVGDPVYKAVGASGLAGPNLVRDDYFLTELVAHEMGHQFGANHTFGIRNGSCNNSSPGTAVEPGSGSTIMSYAGTCGADDIQGGSEPYFHAVSLSEMRAHLATVPNAGTVGAVTNAIPIAQVSPNVSNIPIPPRTPFTLTATATDADSDVLTYTWEQTDGVSTTSQLQTIATEPKPAGALFRSYLPGVSGVRTFPALTSVLSNTTNQETGSCTSLTNATQLMTCRVEFLPTTARTMDFRATVRDNRGGVNTAQVNVEVQNTDPFTVTSPNTEVTYVAGSSETITWNTAGSETWATPLSTVDILTSLDGGKTWSVIADSTANDGTENVALPSTPTTRARIMVRPENGIFFDVSNTNFTLSTSTLSAPDAPVDVVGTVGTGQATITWTSPAWEGGSAVTNYTVTASPGSHTCTSSSATNCIVTGLTNGTSYNFVVTATNSTGTGPASTAIVVTPELPPSAPTGLVTTAGARYITLSWTPPTTSGSSPVNQFRIHRQTSLSGTASYSYITTTVNPYRWASLTNGTTYYFKVFAIADNGLMSAAVVSSAAVPVDAPGKPTAVTGTAGNEFVNVSWTAPSANGSPITGYTVTSSSGATCTTASTNCDVTGLTNGTSYTFTVKATNAIGTGLSSTASAAITPTAVASTTSTAATTSTAPTTTTQAPPSTQAPTTTAAPPQITSTSAPTTTQAPPSTQAPSTTAAPSSSSSSSSSTTASSIASTTSTVSIPTTTALITTTSAPLRIAAVPLPTSASALTPKQAAAVTPATASTITAKQISSVKPSTFAAFSPAVVAALPLSTVKAITTSQAAVLKPSVASAFTPKQFSLLSTKAIAALKTKTLAALRTEQVIALTTKQIRVLTPAKIKTLKLSKLTKQLSAAQQREVKKILNR